MRAAPVLLAALALAAPAGAQTTADPGAQFDALNAGLDSGVLSRAEYEARIAALAQSAAPRGGLRRIDDPSGGHMLVGALGPQASADAAAGAALRQVHAALGDKPAVTRMAVNAAGHSAALFFTASHGGVPVAGMALLNGVPGNDATAAVLFDTAQNLPTSLPAMLHRLGAGGGPGGGEPAPPPVVAAAPAEPLAQFSFPDGTGSIGLPADWKLLNGGGGSAGALGPSGELVTYNTVLTAIDSNNPKGAGYLRGLPAQTWQVLRHSTVVLPYSGNAAASFPAAFRALAQQNGKPPPALTVTQSTPLGAAQGLHMAQIAGEGTLPGIQGKADDAPGVFMGYVQVTPPDLIGQWSLYTTVVFVPKAELARQGETALAVLGSVRINFGAVAAISAATRAQFQKQFEQMIASSQEQTRARTEQSQRFQEGQREHQDQMQKQATAWENYLLDRRTVVDTTNGVHGTVDSDLADLLVRHDPNFEYVPPSRLLRGVDY